MPDAPFPDDQHPLAEDCQHCPALVEARERISWGTGPLEADAVVVGEAPAAGNPDAEQWRGGNLTGMAYTSRHSGRKIRTLLAEAGIESVYYTNAVKCHPPENRDPTDEELANCRPYLLREIEAVEPAAVLPTGKHATRTVLALDDRSLDGFVDTVLEPTRSDALGVRVVPLLHPSYQDVWLSRLGYSRDEYVAEIATVVEA
ncbi:uracil-DNA glycosylase [Halapricum desulfuricans]|uniref:uracil-DNA glycosylase n=1 Tax=Halapricum desulfuricans TaxID=2841257 RepID=UPI001E4F6D65|nr:uracil-DNA glycosylase [Halapricum desulfuricans]